MLARKRKEEIQQNNEAVLAKRREVADMPPVFGNVPVERTYTVQVPAVSEQGLKVGRYVPPCARMALAALSMDNKTSRNLALKTNLQLDWQRRGRLLRHREQPPITFEKHRLSEMFQTSKCFRRGICHCDAGPRRELNAAVQAVSFEDRWIQKMKPLFWARTNKETQKKEKSLGRTLLENAELIVRVHGSRCEPSEDAFWHLGYGNFSSWRFAVLCLALKEEAGDRVVLQALSTTDSVSMLLDAAKDSLDLTQAQEASFYAIAKTDQHGAGVVRADEMLPQIVLAERCPWGDLGVIWRGAAEEIKPKPIATSSESRARPEPRRGACSAVQAGPRTVEVSGIELVLPSAAPELGRLGRQDDDVPDIPNVEDKAAVVELEEDDSADDASDKRSAASSHTSDGDYGDGTDVEQQSKGGEEDAQDASDAEAERLLELFEQEEDAEAEGNPDAAEEVPVEPEAAAVALAPGEEADRRPRGPEAALGLRRPGLPEVAYVLPGNNGEIRYNTNSDVFRALCPYHEDCHRQRAAFEGRSGQGRPLGALLRWVQQGDGLPSRQEHMKLRVDTHENRLRARRELLLMHNVQTITQYERRQRPGEGIEPLALP